MALLAEKSIEQIGFAEIARARRRCRLPSCATMFSSTLAILAAHMKDIDRKVLAGIDPDMAEEPPRERLFDVLMRRIEALAPYKDAVRSLVALGGAQSRPRPRAQRAGGALAAMDADRRRHLGVRAPRHGALAGSRAAVRLGAAHLAGRRRSRPCPHDGGARPRARARAALVGLPRRSLRVPAACLRPPFTPRRRDEDADEETIAA